MITKRFVTQKENNFWKEEINLDELTLNPHKASFWSCVKSMKNTTDGNVPSSSSKEKMARSFSILTSQWPESFDTSTTILQ